MARPGLQARTVVVGGYTAEMGGTATGLTVLRDQAPEAEGPAYEVVAELELRSPSYLVRHPHRPWLYAVSEGGPSTVTSLRVELDGALTVTGQAETGGEAACHLALLPDARRLVVANYGSGSVASFPVRADGDIGPRSDLLAFAGSGTDPERQAGPHAHQVVVAGENDLLVCDLGTDRVHQIRLGGDGGLDLRGGLELVPGTGPRHCVLRDDWLVVAGELSATLWVFRCTPAGWREIQVLPASIRSAQERNLPSGLVAHGDRLFLANRGPGTVSVFDLDRERGTVRAVAEYGAGGAGPRDLTLGAGCLWVANQAEGRVSVFDHRAMPPQRVLDLPLPSPACVVLLGPLDTRAARPSQ